MAKAKPTTKKKTPTKPAAKGRAAAKPKTDTKPKAGDQEVVMDRRRAARRKEAAPDATPAPEPVAAEKEPKIERRAKVNRRRQIDPTTCERDYSNDEIEFMQALDAYKRSSGRMFPTCSEILEVIRDLGYQKHGGAMLDAEPVEPTLEHTPAISDEAPAVE